MHTLDQLSPGWSVLGIRLQHNSQLAQHGSDQEPLTYMAVPFGTTTESKSTHKLHSPLGYQPQTPQ